MTLEAHILAGLTEEERALMAEDDDPADLVATQGELEAKAAAEGDDPAPATPAKADDAKPAPAPEAPAGDAVANPAAGDAPAAAAQPAPAAAAEPAADESGKPAGAETAEVVAAPVLVYQAPADAAEKLEKIASDKKDLAEKFDAGDITGAEFQSQLDALNKDERKIESQVNKAEIAAEMEHQRQKNEWNSQCAAFLKTHPDYNEADAFALLNETVVAYAKMPRNAGLSGTQLLEKAHKAVQAERGVVIPMPKTDAPAAAAPAAPKPGAPKPAPLPNMGAMPAAGGNDPGEGRWASLERLQSSNPMAYEKALASMSDADQEAYLQS